MQQAIQYIKNGIKNVVIKLKFQDTRRHGVKNVNRCFIASPLIIVTKSDRKLGAAFEIVQTSADFDHPAIVESWKNWMLSRCTYNPIKI